MEAATAIADKQQPMAATSAASHEVRLHIAALAKGPYRLRRVPQWVRDANNDAYAPKFMCFGPYHYYNHVGLHHEELKMRYATELLQDAEPRDEARRHQLRRICEQTLREMSTDIREFYADLGPREAWVMTTEAWVKMMFLDGCFILKHLCNYAHGINEEELHQSMWAPAQLRSDLTLLENQIPFAVLLALFDHLAPRNLLPRSADEKKKRRRLLDMALWYMLRGSLSLPQGKRPTDELGVDPEVPVDHLLHLLHVAHCTQLDAAQRHQRPPERDLRGFVSALPIRLMGLLRCLCMLGYEPRPGDINLVGDRTEHVPSAAALKAMGIRITRTTMTWPGPHRDGTLLDVRFMEDSVRLEIPPLYLEQTMASLLQNLIAFEQQVATDGGENYYTAYAFLMSNLISTREDIALLQNMRILHNNFGSDEKTFFRCEEGQEDKAEKVMVKSARKRITDMHYEERLTCIVKYYAKQLGEKITKTQARQSTLTREQYLEMIPWWCESYRECWEMIVDRWFTEGYIQDHEAGRERRLAATGPTHHQGSRSLGAYKQAWSASHGGQSISTFMAYGLARKGKATSNVTFTPDDPPESYSNPSVHTRISSYASEARSVHGPDWDPSTDDIDGTMVMRIGQGKKHGRYWLGDGILEPSEIPSLSQIRAQTPSGGPAIRQRPSSSQQRVDALQAENERMAQELRELVARTEQAERERQAERAERERQAKQLADITMFLQNFGQVNGVPVPQFAPPPPVVTSPPPSAGSNNPSQAQTGDGAFPSPGTQFPPHV